MPQDTHEITPTQFAEAGGIRFAYRRFGRRGGTPLLLLGYFTANLDRWDPKVTNGFAAEREVILVDYPGDCTARSGQRRRLAAQAKDDVSRV